MLNSLPMPLYWIIDSRAELVSAVAEGDVPLSDAMAFLRALSGAKVTGYRKLFDGRNGTSSMTAQELLMVTAEIRTHHSMGRLFSINRAGARQRICMICCEMRHPVKAFGTHSQTLDA